MFTFKPIYFVIFTLILRETQGEISDKRLCIDEKCSELISLGKTLLRYRATDKYMLSFGPNEEVKVYSYGAGVRTDLIGVEIGGKRGYIKMNHFRENKLEKSPKLLVDTELAKENQKREGAASIINPEATKEPFEFVDGTKIPLDLESFITGPSTVPNIVNQKNAGKTQPLAKELVSEKVLPVETNRENLKKIIESVEKLQEESDDPDDTEDDEDEEDDGDDEEDFEEKTKEDDQVTLSNKNDGVTIKTTDSDITTDHNKQESVLDNKEVSENQGHEIKINNDSITKTHVNIIEPLADSFNISTSVDNDQNKAANYSPKEKLSHNVPVIEDVILNEPALNDTSTITQQIPNPEEIEKKTPEKDLKSIKNEEKDKQTELNNKVVLLPTTEPSIEQEALPPLGGFDEVPTTLNPLNTETEDNSPSSDSLPNTSESLSETEEVKVDSSSGVFGGLGNMFPLLNSETLNAEQPKPVESENKDEVQETQDRDSNKLKPIEQEAVPPLGGFDGVPTSLNPLKAETGDNSPPSDSLPPTSETEEVKVDSSVDSSGGVFGGLVNIFPSFNSEALKAEQPKPTESEYKDQVQETQDGSDKIEPIEAKAQEPLDNSLKIDSEKLKPVQAEVQEIQENTFKIDSEDPKPIEDETIKSKPFGDLHFNVPEVSIEPHSSIESAPGKVKVAGYEELEKDKENESNGFFGNVLPIFGGEKNNEEKIDVLGSDSLFGSATEGHPSILSESAQVTEEFCDSNEARCPLIANKGFCDKENQDCSKYEEHNVKTLARSNSFTTEELQLLFIDAFTSDLFLYLTTTALAVIILIFIVTLMEKCRREGPMIARINKLEQELLATLKENDMLQEKATLVVEEKTQLVVETVPNEEVEELKHRLAEISQVKLGLEEQIQALEKELDTSTEVGIELNKIISEMLNSSDGSEILRENVEQMQKKLLEQQDTINNISESLKLKETENHELRLELEISNKKVIDLQGEVDKRVEKILKIEEERDQQHGTLENEIEIYQAKYKEALGKEHILSNEIQLYKQQITEYQRVAEIKTKEYNILKESLNEVKSVKNNKEALMALLAVSEVKAQLEQMKSENLKYSEQLKLEREANVGNASKIRNLITELKDAKEKYEKADKDKVEINTKLEVLNNYFKEKEEQMQKEIVKYESLWASKEGEATSTTERIRYMQDELQNYKAQNESLKQEIVNQEVELKSQISMLEKKNHENWVTNRQTERKLEEARQEAAQLRHRLTLRERAIAEGNKSMRMQSPLHQNGEIPLSPPPLDHTQSPPPIFNPRDHMTKSPHLPPGMPPPPPFLPPPLGAGPFIPPPPLEGMSLPPLGDMPPHFMPPLMFPGDHRPPPLGRMSSPPPVGGRYSPESTVYSDYDRYDRRSPSPPYDSEYGASPPPIRGYSPYNDRLRDDRREYKRTQIRSNGRNSKGLQSSGSENDSLGKLNKKSQRKV